MCLTYKTKTRTVLKKRLAPATGAGSGKYGTLVWYRFITLGGLHCICSAKPLKKLNRLVACSGNTVPDLSIRYWVRYRLSFRINQPYFVQANLLKIVQADVDPEPNRLLILFVLLPVLG